MTRRGTKQERIERLEYDAAQYRKTLEGLRDQIGELQEQIKKLEEAAAKDDKLCQECEEPAHHHLCEECRKVRCQYCGEVVELKEATCTTCVGKTEIESQEITDAFNELLVAADERERRWAIERAERALEVSLPNPLYGRAS